MFIRIGIAMCSTIVLSLFGLPASASIQTWVFSGTLNGNSLQAEPILVDGVAGTTANLTAAGVVINAAFSATVTFDTATPERLNFLGSPDPQFGVYPTGGFNWNLGSLSARSAHRSQAILYALDFNIVPPPGTPLVLDVIAISGGDPPAWNGGALQVRTEAADPDIPGDTGSVPGIALAMFPNTLSSNAQLVNPPFSFFIVDKGFNIPLLDTETGQEISLAGSIGTVSGGGSIPACGAGDTDFDTICDDVDLCIDDYDITQYDTDGNGIADACNDAFDTDGDEWEDGFDNCPEEFNLTNFCGAAVPALGPWASVLLIGLLGLAGLVRAAKIGRA